MSMVQSALTESLDQPVYSESFSARLRWAIADSWTVASGELIHWVRNPGLIAYSLVSPIIFVILFGYVLGSAMSVAGGGDYREFLMPGMFVQTVVFGVLTTITAIATYTSKGITDRFRSMPMSPIAVVGGRGIADMLNSVLELVMLIGCGLAIGWRFHGSAIETASAIGLLFLLRFSLVWIGIYIGLHIPSPEAAMIGWLPLYPLTMIANTFVSPELMPPWLEPIAAWNPISATVTATRDLFGNPGTGGDAWIVENALLMAVIWPLILIAVFFPLSVRKYRDLSR